MEKTCTYPLEIDAVKMRRVNFWQILVFMLSDSSRLIANTKNFGYLYDFLAVSLILKRVSFIHLYEVNVHLNFINYMKLLTKVVHDKVKPHKCDLCNKTYGLEHILQKHVKAIHSLNKHLQCESCGKCFGSKQDLKKT